MNTSPRPEYAVLLDSIAPLAAPRANLRGWDTARWTRTLRIAEWHRLSPSLFAHLRSIPATPAWVHQALERAYLTNAARNMFVRASLHSVIDALAVADVPSMLLKGAALVETVYPDPALREMLDLDILVPASRLASANTAVARLGYRVDPGADQLPTVHQLDGVAEHHDPALIGEERLLAVELHHHIAIAGEGNGFDIEDLWQRARTPRGSTYLLPAPEDLLLHVCLHFTRNRLGGNYRRRNTGGALAQVCDIARIIDHHELDWAALAATARHYRMDVAVFMALFAARELGVPVSGDALAGLAPRNFDPAIGRHLVTLRVLKGEEHLPVRSARRMLFPSREVLSRGWAADPAMPLSLARAYVQRAAAYAPLARTAVRRPWRLVQDHRLNDQIQALQEQW